MECGSYWASFRARRPDLFPLDQSIYLSISTSTIDLGVVTLDQKPMSRRALPIFVFSAPRERFILLLRPRQNGLVVFQLGTVFRRRSSSTGKDGARLPLLKLIQRCMSDHFSSSRIWGAFFSMIWYGSLFCFLSLLLVIICSIFCKISKGIIRVCVALQTTLTTWTTGQKFIYARIGLSTSPLFFLFYSSAFL